MTPSRSSTASSSDLIRRADASIAEGLHYPVDGHGRTGRPEHCVGAQDAPTEQPDERLVVTPVVGEDKALQFAVGGAADWDSGDADAT